METENISRYKKFQKLKTNRTINDPAGVIAGRTMGECCLTLVVFFGLSYANYTFIGLLIAASYFYFSVKIREKYPRAIVQHIMYAVGVFGKGKNGKNYNPPAYFTIKNKISIRRA